MREKVSLLKRNIQYKNLMPGGDNITSALNNSNDFLYVGGIKPHIYDVSKMLEAFKKSGAKLKFCCRLNEWNEYSEYYKEFLSDNIEVIHLNADDIKETYQKVSYTIMFYEPKEYRKFAIPFKLFEYISYEKPIIASRNTAASGFIEENKIGYSLKYDDSSLKEFLNQLPSKDEYKEIVINLKKVKSDNTWEKRAEKIAQELSDCDYNEEK